MNTYYKYIGLTLGMMVAGFLLWSTFFNSSIQQLDAGSTILNTDPQQIRSGRTILMLALGITPLLYLLSMKIAKSTAIKNSIITIGIILFSGILMWQLRIMVTNSKLNRLTDITGLSDIRAEFQIADLQPELYLLIGFVLGAICSGISQRYLNKHAA